MAFDPTADQEVFLAEGKQAISGDVTFQCYLDYPDEVELAAAQMGGTKGAGIVQGRPRITYAAADIDLGNGVQVAIDGVNYKVRQTHRLDDGLFAVAELIKAS